MLLFIFSFLATSSVFSKPTWTTYGQCRKDTFQAWSAGSPSTPILCGTNSGYHSKQFLVDDCLQLTVNSEHLLVKSVFDKNFQF